MEQRIYTIIVTYNGMQWIEKCLTMLRQSTVHTDVIVIDNNSTDGTQTFIPEHFPEVVWMPQTQNLGFGQGNNLGMKYALEHEADYVLLLNQDAYLQPTAFEEMLRVADDASLVSPVHLCGDGSRIDLMFRESLKRADNQLIDDLLLNGSPAPSYDVGEVCAACWFMPVALIEEVGGFNPLFFQYGEDNNYYTRMVYHGKKVILAARARVWHDRQVHGDQKLYTQKEIMLRLMVNACNPNLSCLRRMYKGAVLFVQSPSKTIKGLLQVVMKMPSIRKSIKAETMKGRIWL